MDLFVSFVVGVVLLCALLVIGAIAAVGILLGVGYVLEKLYLWL